MGMFDSMYDDDNNEWQTKAFDCHLDRWRVGDELPYVESPDYQVEIFGGSWNERAVESYATIRGHKLKSINDQRDDQLSLLDYHGGWSAIKEGHQSWI